MMPGATPAESSLKISYSAEVVRFESYSGEDFCSHRLGFSGRHRTGPWKISGEASSLFIAGSRDTLISSSAMNANAVSLWRERRRQWQHRLKLLAQRNVGAGVVRASGTWLNYDYQTRVVAGKFAFANRSDAQAGLDLGWNQSAHSLWLIGVHAGRQNQSVIPLPNCAFDYSNDSGRLVAGWEGKPWANTTVTFAGGPDFRHYTGVVDSRVFPGGRTRRSLRFEGNFTTKLSATLILTGKATQFDWLSSTGKSAYVDSSAEIAATWKLSSEWTGRFTAKVYRCRYFPATRDDLESLLGIGTTRKLSQQAQFGFDLLQHRGGNQLTQSTGREFRRLVISASVSIKL